jgi:hypothetical protein
VSSTFGQSAAGFNPGGFDLNKSFTEYKFDVPSFGTGVDAGGGFAGSSGVAGKFKGLFDGLFGGDDDDVTFGQALGLATLQGNLGIEAANRNSQAAEVAALNAQNSLLTDYNLQRIGKGDRQRFNTNRLGRQENLMAVVPSAIANATYNTNNPNVGAAMGAQLAGMLG